MKMMKLFRAIAVPGNSTAATIRAANSDDMLRLDLCDMRGGSIGLCARGYVVRPAGLPGPAGFPPGRSRLEAVRYGCQ